MPLNSNADIPAFDPTTGLTKREWVATQLLAAHIARGQQADPWLIKTVSVAAVNLLQQIVLDSAPPYPFAPVLAEVWPHETPLCEYPSAPSEDGQ
jgi:hypothetical protein